MFIEVFRKLDWFGLRQQRLYNGKIDATWWQKKAIYFQPNRFLPGMSTLDCDKRYRRWIRGCSPVDISHVILVLYI